ncbi:PepSY-associated TM helix domain-containing protein [Aquisalinus flavus]|uniref:PepSY domain-containing protein n=1 Tax=Aquisalinus flavus TaxID=1526572 RepID=A0A8J2V4F1_9PROT|nr:PepSY-associated TM helix domain-containing protein [Aquisalinus flavus]MBD0426715.1 PepSY domain-containing protein [Aquisalinus flavus]UNE46580.1 PepSY domain-containing protein [Aquisalinus flavus]GGC95389.1 hypothetical protein GCM10011342_00250 [Aquisalinus flavus]
MARPGNKNGKKKSRLWFDIHSWVGLKLSLFVSFILITGTLAVISNELDWLANGSMRVMPQAQSERVSWGTLYEAARADYPDMRLSYFTGPLDPWFAAGAYGQMPDGERRLIDINPYTGEVTGDRGWMSFQRFLRNTHRHLMLPVKWGVPLVSALSFLLIASMISGLIVYKKFWRGFLKQPRTRDARTLNGDLHRLVALWTLWFVPVIALTGLFYLAESLGWRAPSFGETGKAREVEITLTGEMIDEMAARAEEVQPGLDISVMLPPTRPGQPLVFQGYTDGTWLVRARASYVAFDPATGAVLGTHRSRDAGLHQRIAEMADPLHFGTFGGIWTKLIWFVFGAALSALSVTGVVIYGQRMVRSAMGTAKGTGAAPPAGRRQLEAAE